MFTHCRNTSTLQQNLYNLERPRELSFIFAEMGVAGSRNPENPNHQALQIAKRVMFRERTNRSHAFRVKEAIIANACTVITTPATILNIQYIHTYIYTPLAPQNPME